jgi:hypothetical protein
MKQRQLLAEGAKVEAVVTMSRPLELERRERTLAVADGLLQRLTPEEAFSLRAWVEASKAGISVTVPKADLAFFRLPR